MGNFYMESTQINYRRDEKLKTVDQKLQELSETSAIDTDIAPVFKSTSTYQPGDMVYYRNKLYVFNVEHTGTWAAADVTATDVTTEISSLMSGLTNYQAQNDLNLEVPNRVNLIESLQDAYFETNGAISASNIRVSTSKIIKIPKGTYTASAVSSVSGKTVEIAVSQWENDKTDGTNTRISVSAWASSAYTFTVNNDSYVSVTCRYSDGSTTSKNDFSVQLELGSIATAYTPYIPSVESRIEAVESDVNEINSNLSNKQDVTDNTLTTTSKTVVGAINELQSGLSMLAGISVKDKSTGGATDNVVFTLTSYGRYSGILIITGNANKCALYYVYYSGENSVCEKIAGNYAYTVSVNETSGNITATLNDWSKATLISTRVFS